MVVISKIRCAWAAGAVPDGEVLDGEVLDGEVLDGEVLDGEVLDGAGPRPAGPTVRADGAAGAEYGKMPFGASAGPVFSQYWACVQRTLGLCALNTGPVCIEYWACVH
ncbi:MAG: hypothetical protein EXR77_02300 [Myxococcales bacterium]|nr:hypothetical protein [Myxococcales bacterium]